VVTRSDKPSDQIEPRRYGNQSAGERRAERRRRLLGAAVDRFSERGFVDTSIEELCTAARVSTRSFYEEFGSREAILCELHDRLNDAAIRAVRGALAGSDPGDVVDMVGRGVRAYLSIMTEDRAWARVVLIESVGVSPELERRRQRALDSFARLIAREAKALAEAGVLAQRDYSLTAVAVVGAIKELVTAWAVRSTVLPLEAVAEEGIRIMVAAIARDPIPAA
jgi:AcrR family transcriptional regulator